MFLRISGVRAPLNNSFPDCNYGNSDYDIRHRFTFEVTYALPGMKSPGQLLQGWVINSIVTMQPGTPWAVQDTSNDFSGTGEVNKPNPWGEAWNFHGNPKDFNATPAGIPFFGPCTQPTVAHVLAILPSASTTQPARRNRAARGRWDTPLWLTLAAMCRAILS